MAKKRNKLSYAAAARKIVKKYEKRLGKDLSESDPMAQAALAKELEALMQKQEATRAQMLEADQVTAPAMAYGGGLPQMYDGGDVPWVNPAGEKGDTWWGGVPTEAKIGAIAQGAGVIGSGIANIVGGRTDPLEYNPTSPLVASYVNNDEAIRQSNLAFQDAMRSSRGLSAGRYYSQMGKLASDRGRSAAGIAEQTANANAQIDNQVAAQNAQLSLQNEQGRMGAQQYNDAQTQQRAGYLGDMMGDVGKVVAGAGADSLAYKSEENAIRASAQPGYEWVKDSKGRSTYQTNVGGSGLSYYRDSGTGDMVYKQHGKEISPTEYEIEYAAWRKKETENSLANAKAAKSK